MKTVKFKGAAGKNFTPDIIKALAHTDAELLLEFESGEYHFYKDGSLSRFFAVSNNDNTKNKDIVFPIIGKKNVIVDGGGAVFVFHDVTFPFAVHESCAVTIRNLTVDTALSPTGVFTVGKVTGEGFFLEIDKEKSPYYIENGALMFPRESSVRSGICEKFDLHALSRRRVQYLFTGECRSSRENLPAQHVLTDAEEREDGLFLRYRKNNPYKLAFFEGERISAILDGGRESDVIFLSRSEDIKIENVTVRRGIGMGVIAQLTKNIEIDGLRTDESHHSEGSTLTADSMHFVNCSGALDIHNCDISYTLDDAINVHGMYTRVECVGEDTVTVRIGHEQQYYFNPYSEGDVLLAVDDESFEYTGSLKVKKAALSDDGSKITLTLSSRSGKIYEGELIEAAERMPNVHIHDNRFYSYPHLRISGGGDILIENNSFERSIAALLCKDLAKYWYESGRVKNLVFRNNTLKDCNALAGVAFITVDVDGIDRARTPKIHGRVEISHNRIAGVRTKAIIAAGVRELVIEDNEFEKDTDRAVEIDGVSV